MAVPATSTLRDMCDASEADIDIEVRGINGSGNTHCERRSRSRNQVHERARDLTRRDL